jgi:hypothetical protein
MKQKKYIIVEFLVFLVFVIPVLFNVYLKKLTHDIVEKIDNENVNDLVLTIYYMDPKILTPFALDIKDLVARDDIKIVISGSELEKHIDLFKQISNNVLTPIIKITCLLDFRVYYVLESEKNGKLFDVAMWGDNQSIFVNGLEVKENDIFYRMIMPFLPEDDARRLWDLRVD